MPSLVFEHSTLQLWTEGFAALRPGDYRIASAMLPFFEATRGLVKARRRPDRTIPVAGAHAEPALAQFVDGDPGLEKHFERGFLDLANERAQGSSHRVDR